jgi:hypothetical protein
LILRKTCVARPPDQVGGKLLGRVFKGKEVWHGLKRLCENDPKINFKTHYFTEKVIIAINMTTILQK